jgi:DNA-binding transcriptional ArsR family regulator
MPRPPTADDVFRAIADPTRRALLDTLRTDGEQSVGALAAPFHLTLPGLSRHLKVLRDGGLVTERRQGRHRFYRLNAAPLRPVAGWIAEYEGFWNAHLDALGGYLQRRSGAGAGAGSSEEEH